MSSSPRSYSLSAGDRLVTNGEYMAAIGDNRYVDRIYKYFQARGIPTSGVGAITVQKNRTSKFSSLVLDFDRGEILDLYPAELLDK